MKPAGQSDAASSDAEAVESVGPAAKATGPKKYMRKPWLYGIGAIGLGVAVAAAGFAYTHYNANPAVSTASLPSAATSQIAHIKDLATQLELARKAGNAVRTVQLSSDILERATELQTVYGSASGASIQDTVFAAALAVLPKTSDRTQAAVARNEQAVLAMSILTEPAARVELARRLVIRQDRSKAAQDRVHDLVYRVSADLEALGPGAGDPLLAEAAQYFAAFPDMNSLASAYQLAGMMVAPKTRSRITHEVALKHLLSAKPAAGLAASLSEGKADAGLVAAAWGAVRKKEIDRAMLLALAVADDRVRDRMLSFVSTETSNANDASKVLPAIMAIGNDSMRDRNLLRYVNRAVNFGLLRDGAQATARIGDPASRSIGQAILAQSYAAGGYRKQASYYLNQIGGKVGGGAMQSIAQAHVAQAWAMLDEPGKAADALARATDDSAVKRRAALQTARSMAMAKTYSAREIAALGEGVSGDERWRIAAIAAGRALDNGNPQEADSIVAALQDPVDIAHAHAIEALDRDMPRTWTERAREQAGRINRAGFDRSVVDAAFDVTQGRLDGAIQALHASSNWKLAAQVATALAAKLGVVGRMEDGEKLADLFDVDNTSARMKIHRALAVGLGKGGRLAEAARFARGMDDREGRVSTFRALAMQSARRNDGLNALRGQELPKPVTDGHVSTPAPIMRRASFYEFAVGQDSLGDKIPTLPNATRYNADSVLSQVPALEAGKVAHVRITPLANNGYNKKFLTAKVFSDVTLGGPSVVMRAQKTTYPVYVDISRGTIDMPTLYEKLVLSGHADMIERKGRVYTVRVPIFVATGATLVISDSDVSDLRLSTQRAAYLVNAGRVIFSGVDVVGWDEAAKAPSPMSLDKINEYRPFYVGWSNSVTLAVHSHFQSLGSLSGKAYGFSLSAGPLGMMSSAREKRAPSGLLVENTFEHMYYGFYSWEAAHVSIIGNEYRDNLIYGVDPHDWSNHLLVAFNTAYGAHKKHGIIGSRHVENSWFLGNLTFDNHGSGLMMDRFSGRNILYANTAFGNGGNGISIYESPCNIVSSNNLYSNTGSGVIYRNSWDVGIFRNRIADNRKLGIGAYAVEFVVKPGAPNRNLALDPYEQFATGSVAQNRIVKNGGGAILMRGMGAATLQDNTIIGPARRAYLGDLRTIESDIARAGKGGLTIGGSCPKPRIRYACPFAEEGYLPLQLGLAAKAHPRYLTCPSSTTVNEQTAAATGSQSGGVMSAASKGML